MGLITTYDDTNKVTDRGLAIRYSSELVQNDDISYYQLTRYCTKSYSYVGMDYQTAVECASVKRAQYTRDYARISTSSLSSTLPTIIYIKECPVDIAPQHTAGDMWQVDIQVNELDIRYSETNPESIEAEFTAENARNYDEGNGSQKLLNFTGAVRSGTSLTAYYTQNIAGFNPQILMLQYKLSESGTLYNVLPNQFGSYTAPNQALWCNLAYGNITSNTIQVD